MSANKQKHAARVAAITQSAEAVRNVCVDAMWNDGAFIQDDGARMNAVAAAAKSNHMFEALGDHAGGVAIAWGTAIKEFYDCYGTLPSDEILASAAQSLQNITVGLNAGTSAGGQVAMLESIGTSLATSEGVEIRAKQAGLILPVMLMAATSDAVTYIPAEANETEIFEIRRVAGNTFGDYTAGEELGLFSNGQYASMNQIYPFLAAQQPDGEIKAYQFDSTTAGFGLKVPFKKGSVKLMANRKIVANEVNGQAGKLYGAVTVGGSEIVINGTINYTNGVADVATATALPAGMKLMLEFDIDIEKQADLIPTINHDMQSWTLRPHESAIAAEHTVQSYWLMNREFSLDIRSMQMNHLRNYLAYEKDLRNLRKMLIAATETETFDLTVPAGLRASEHYETLNRTLLTLSQALLVRTKVSGLTGLYMGASACAIVKSLDSTLFEYAPNYQQVPRIHYVGKLFGQFKVFEVPTEIEAIKGVEETKLGTWDCLCYARGEQHTQAGIVAGDAVPATLFAHETTKALVDRNTLWELAYCDIHPNDGGRYFTKLTFVPAQAGQAG